MANYDYEDALKAAGGIILADKKTGCHTGELYFKCQYQGETGWVRIWEGTCSECDAFINEFGDHDDYCKSHEEYTQDCSECQKALHDFKKRLADFGRIYLEIMESQAEIEEHVKNKANSELYCDELLKWIIEQR